SGRDALARLRRRARRAGGGGRRTAACAAARGLPVRGGSHRLARVARHADDRRQRHRAAVAGSDERFFFPIRVIEVSPIRFDRFIDAAPRVLGSELRWVWLPALAASLTLAVLRRIGRA